jgi:predicted esterase
MAMVCSVLAMGAMLVAPLARPATAATRGGSDEFPVASDGPAWIETDRSRAFVYPPRRTLASPGPLTVVLHGMCGEPLSVCAPFVGGATARGWLVCPRAQDACGGGSRWSLRANDDVRSVEASVEALAQERTGQVDVSAPRVVVGFSLGGFVAVRLAESPGRLYEGLVVIASQVSLEAAPLRKAGVRRVVLAAGDYDMTSKPLQESARALDRAGLPARFVSLGPYGHGYPPDMEERMREPMEWVKRAD